MTFAIWYANGNRIVGVSRDDWLAAPSENVVGVASILGHDQYGRTLGRYAAGGDWYWWTDEGIDSGASSWEPGTWIDYDGPDGQATAKRGIWVAHTRYALTQYEMREFLR